jgi:hypothetical protein
LGAKEDIIYFFAKNGLEVYATDICDMRIF